MRAGMLVYGVTKTVQPISHIILYFVRMDGASSARVRVCGCVCLAND